MLLSISENLSISRDNDVIRAMKALLDKIIGEYWQMSLEDNINQSLEQRQVLL